MTCAPWNPVGCVSDVAKSAAGDAFSSIAHDFGRMADSAVNWLWGQMSDATAVHLGGAAFSTDIGIVATIAVTVAVGLFAIQLTSSALRRDGHGLARAVKGLIVAFIGGGLAIGATGILLSAVDSLSAGVVQATTGQPMAEVGHRILSGTTLEAVSSNPAAIIVLSMAALVAVVIVWAALMIRKVLIVISAVFAPLAFAGSLADITASWVRRWIEVTVALIVSKLILVIIFVVGLDMLVDGVGQAGTGTTQKATQAISGVLVLALAGFAPWLALKLVHFTGDQFHHLHNLGTTSAAGAQKMISVPQKAASWASIGAGGGAAATAATGAAGRAGGAGAVGSGGGNGGSGGGPMTAPVPTGRPRSAWGSAGQPPPQPSTVVGLPAAAAPGQQRTASPTGEVSPPADARTAQRPTSTSWPVPQSQEGRQ